MEQRAQLDHASFIDVLIPTTHVMAEQNSIGKDLRDLGKEYHRQ